MPLCVIYRSQVLITLLFTNVLNFVIKKMTDSWSFYTDGDYYDK
jgi:hypothetical protein